MRGIMTMVMLVSLIFVNERALADSSSLEHRTPGQLSHEQHGKRAAIVIDDFGNNMAGTEDMMKLPIEFTVAVMPFLPTTKRDAAWAHSLGHQVIVHLPMEPKRGKASWLGPGAIMTNQSDEEVRKRVEAAIADVPFAVGMNNHMGSKATADERVMRIVLKVCKENGLFFLDSRTNYRSVVAAVGKQIGVPVVENHMFFDDIYTNRHISKQMKLFQKHLAEHDVSVAIGHVGPPGKKTADVLRRSAADLQKTAELVPVSVLAGHPFVP